MRDHQRRLLYFFNDLGNRIRLAGSRCAQQYLRRLAILHAGGEIDNCLGLIALGLKRSHDFKRLFVSKLHRIKFRHHCHMSASFRTYMLLLLL